MITTTTKPATSRPSHREPPARPQAARSRIGLIVAGSMAAGLVAAALLVIAPLAPAKEHSQTGMVLLGFALGWALLAGLSAPVRRPTATLGGRAGPVHGGRRGRCTHRFA